MEEWKNGRGGEVENGKGEKAGLKGRNRSAQGDSPG